MGGLHGISGDFIGEAVDRVFFGYSPLNCIPNVVFPLLDVGTLFVQVTFVAQQAVTRHEDLLVQPAQGLDRRQPLVGAGFLDIGLDLVEDVVAGPDHTFFFDADGGLVSGVAGHVNHFDGVIANVQGHAVLESDNRKVRSVALHQLRLVGSEAGNPRDVRSHVGFLDAPSHPFLGDNRRIEERVPGPVIAVGFSVDDVTQLSMLCDLRLQLHGVGRAVGTVEHDHSVGRDKEPEVTTHAAGVRVYVTGDLLQCHLGPPI